jgi:cyclohexadienyl dehydratase
VLRLVVLSIVGALFVSFQPAVAENSRLDEIIARGALRVGTTGDYRPFTALDKTSGALERAKKGFFSIPYLREGKTPIARCADKDKYQTLADIDRSAVTVIVNPGGTNEKFDRAHFHNAQIAMHPDNTTIFDALASGKADLMITDASETRYQQKLHPGALCAIHPDKPFDFAEKAYWMPRDEALKAFVDQWLHMSMENGVFTAEVAKWLE